MFSQRTNWKLSLNRFTQAQREIAASGREVLDLTVSNPTRAGLRFEERSILDALSDPAAMDYDPQPKGLRSAREAVAHYYQEQHGVRDADPEALFLTTSTSEAYSCIFRLLCNVGDEVLVPKPSYPLFEFLADLQDVKLVPYPLIYDHGWQVDFPSLQSAVSDHTRAIVLVHPNNPTGSYISHAERDGLNDFCLRHNLALIVDEVFLDYSLEGAPHSTFLTNSQSLTFTLSGLSKISCLPQMKLAWVAVTGPRELMRTAVDRLEVIADTYLSLNAPVQHAAATFLGQRKQVQPALLDRIRTNLSQLDAELSRQSVCERLQVQGGWYAVLRVPVTQSDEDLAIAILQRASVLVHPGHFYDFPRDGFLVLSLIALPAVFEPGIRRLLQQVSD